MMELTFSFTEEIVFSHSGAERTVSINSTISSINGSFPPRVVMAGVPKRKPDVKNGERLSNGDHVFVCCDVCGNKGFLCHLTSQFRKFGAEVYQHTVVVCSARDDFVSLVHECLCHYGSVFLYLLLVNFVFGL